MRVYTYKVTKAQQQDLIDQIRDHGPVTRGELVDRLLVKLCATHGPVSQKVAIRAVDRILQKQSRLGWIESRGQKWYWAGGEAT